MKYLFIIYLFGCPLAPVTAQNGSVVPDTVVFSVSGACSMCKSRIESAAPGKGVKKASWDRESQMLTLIFRPDKTSPQEVGTRIANMGYDNQYATSSDEAYKRLPECCNYRTIKTH